MTKNQTDFGNEQETNNNDNSMVLQQDHLPSIINHHHAATTPMQAANNVTNNLRVLLQTGHTPNKKSTEIENNDANRPLVQQFKNRRASYTQVKDKEQQKKQVGHGGGSDSSDNDMQDKRA